MKIVVKASVTSNGPRVVHLAKDLCFANEELHQSMWALWDMLNKPRPLVHGMTMEMWDQFGTFPSPKPITLANLLRVAEALGFKITLQSGKF